MLGVRQRQQTIVVWAATIVVLRSRTSSLAAASSAYKSLSTPRSSTSISEDAEENDSFKSKDEWWKDPLAMFEDEEDVMRNDDNKIPSTKADRELPKEEDVIEFFPEELPEGEEVDELVGERQREDELVFPDERDELVLPDEEEELELLPEEEDEEDMMEMIDEQKTFDRPMEEDPDVFEELPKEKEEAEPIPEPVQRKKRTFPSLKRQEAEAPNAPKKRKPRQKSHNEIGPQKSKQVVSASASSPLAFTGVVPQLTSLLSNYPGVKLLGFLALGKAVSVMVKTAVPKTKRINDEGNIEEAEGSFEPEEENEESVVDEDLEQEEQVEQEEEQVSQASNQTPAAVEQREDDIVRGNSGWFRFLKRERLPPARELMEQVEELKRSCELAETDKKNLEREYEKASWQLQEAQSELKNLKQTTRYLQTQIRDNEEILTRAVKSERRKAREELVRMKEAMVKVVEKEREAMREEFMKQAAELQTMWKGKKKVHAD